MQRGHFRPNTPATGAPTISGTARVGETLTVNTSDIADEDGMENATYTFSWFVDFNTDTAYGERRSKTSDTTYRVQPRDAGFTITVQARFNDDYRNTEIRTSAATAAVAATEPYAPQNLNVSLHGAGALNLSWEAPSWDEDAWFDRSENVGDGGSSITRYKVQWKESADSWDTPADVSEATVTGTTYTITGLTNGVRYRFRVLATNDVGDGSWSAVVPRTPRTIPSAPAIDSVTPGGRMLTVAWTASADDGGASVTGYDMRYIRSDASNKADANWTVWDGVWSSGALRYNLIGLTNGVGYDVQARAVNSVGEGPWSGTHTGTPRAAPDAPTLDSVTPGDRMFTVAWSAPSDDGGAGVTGYDLRHSRSDAPNKADANWTVNDSVWSSGALRYNLIGLTNGVGYDVQVRAVNSVGPGAWSGSGSGKPQTTPGAPSVNSLTPGDEMLTVAWSAPAEDGGSNVTGYDLRHIRSDAPNKADANWTVNDSVWSSGELRYGLAGLTNGVEYDVRMRAVNAAGNGPWSSTVSATPLTVPGRPGSTIMVTPGDETLTVAWSAPSDDGGAGVTGYDLRHIPSGAADKADPNWTVETGVGSSTSLQYNITGLTNGMEYDVQVRAVNAAGDGSWSSTHTETPVTSELHPSNTAPVFAEGASTTRSVDENTPAGTGIGNPVLAADADNDPLTYTLGGDDAGSFDIDAGTGQIGVGDGTALDYEADKNTYSVVVAVTDPSGASDTIAVTITVNDVDLQTDYDANNDETIDKGEAVAAVIDYFSGVITKREAIEVAKLYFDS